MCKSIGSMDHHSLTWLLTHRQIHLCYSILYSPLSTFTFLFSVLGPPADFHKHTDPENRLRKFGGGAWCGYPVRRRSQSSWSSTSCCHHPGAGPSELSTPSGPTQPHCRQSGLPALGLMQRCNSNNVEEKF